MERFCDLKEEITAFLLRSKLKRAETYLTQILDDNFIADVCFLCDIFRHLNDLNMRLQGRDKTVIDLVKQMDVMSFAQNPFTAATHQDLSTKANNGPARFWCNVNVHQFPIIKKVAVRLLSMFGSTYTCESSFSHMNMIKNSYRCSLTDSTLNHCLRIALTSYEPNIHALVQNKRCHFSH
uniref:HAT C-terminal dimerisation domain-containing protein n=1 Tax=Gouania willdenowi TaxID=441366 RepID=A0A8C5DSP2_GOUWI